MLPLHPPNHHLKYALYVAVPTVVIGCYVYYRYKRAPTTPTITPTTTTHQNLKQSGNALFKVGKYDQALALYTEAIEKINKTNDEEDREALEQLYQNRAAVYEKLGNYDKVVKETTSALALNPKYVKALHRRSKALKATGFLDESLEDITKVCILEQFTSPSSIQLADDILKQIGSLEGQKLLEKREKDGGGLKPSRHTCTSYLRGFYNCPVSKVIVGREEILDDEEEGPLSRALLLLRTQNYDEIIPLCTEHLEHFSTHRIEAHYLRGTFRFLYGHNEAQTLSDFQETLTSPSPAYKASALIKMASHYALVDKPELCEASFEESAKVWPDNVDLFHHQGQVQLTRGMLPNALDLLTKASELAPTYPIAVATKWYVEYRILAGGGDFTGAQECIRQFEQMTEKFPSSPDVFSLYGQILMENNRFKEAEEQFSRVTELDSSNAGVHVHRAMAKFQQTNNVQEAISMLEEALVIDDRNEFVYETIGTLHLQSGDLSPAITYISKALSLARSIQELTILSSLLKAAVVQKKVRDEMGLSVDVGFFK